MTNPGGPPLLYDNFIKKNLERIKQTYLKKKFDWVNCIEGFPGMGKTTLAVKCSLYIDPSFSLDQVCFTAEKYFDVTTNLSKGKSAIFDEAGMGLLGRESMSKMNITLIKLFMTIRNREIFHNLVIPKFIRLDTNISADRVMSLMSVNRRGQINFYSRRRVVMIAENKSYKRVYPNFRATFPDRNPKEFDWEGYEKAKDKFQKKYFSDGNLGHLQPNRDHELVDAAKKNIDKYTRMVGSSKRIDHNLIAYDFKIPEMKARLIKRVLERDVMD